jgi:hypothetical protein
MLQLYNVSMKPDSSGRDELGCEVVDLPRCGMILFRQWEDGCGTSIEQRVLEDEAAEYFLAIHLPMALSKSGTTAASVIIINWMVFCHSDH